MERPDDDLCLTIAYVGLGLSGKTSNLLYVYHRTPAERRGQMVSVSNARERSLSFELVPQTLPPVRGRRVRLRLHTTPGTVYYDLSRERALRDAAAVVLVVDSQRARLDANVEFLADLTRDLAHAGRAPTALPWVVQYNKRDLPDAAPVDALDAALNPRGAPRFEAVAARGEGVFDTLRAAARCVLEGFERAG